MMDPRDVRAAQRALTEWFVSQDIKPQEACMITALTCVDLLAARFPHQPSFDIMFGGFVALMEASGQKAVQKMSGQ